MELIFNKADRLDSNAVVWAFISYLGLDSEKPHHTRMKSFSNRPDIKVELKQCKTSTTRHTVKACLLSLKRVSRSKLNVDKLLESFGYYSIESGYLKYVLYYEKSFKHKTCLIFHECCIDH